MGRGRSIVICIGLGAATFACDGGTPPSDEGRTAAPAVSRVEATGAVPGGRRLGVMDGTLLGIDHGGWDSTQATVVVSHDDGRTWTAAELPDRPAGLDLASSNSPYDLYVGDDVAAVVGRDTAPAVPGFPVAQSQFIVWTSTDGDRWTGHRLDTAGGVVVAPAVTAMGPLLVASSNSAHGFNVFTSSDRGTSWRRAEITGLRLPNPYLSMLEASTDDTELWMALTGMETAEGGLILRSGDGGVTWAADPCGFDCPEMSDLVHRGAGKTSTDGGASWHEIEIDPPPRPDTWTYLSAVVELDGGWLASAEINDSEDFSYDMLLRSDDGRSWRQVLPTDLCHDRFGRPKAMVGDPIRFDGRWYVTYRCPDASTGTAGSVVVYAADAAGRTFEPVEGTERDGVRFGDPIVDDDRLVLPEFGDELVAVTTIG